MIARPEDAAMGAIIRKRRLAAGLTQEQLGAAAGGVSYQQVQKYETGANRVSVSRLLDIAKALGVGAADLVKELDRELLA